jgi:hypothetical protein
LKVVLSEAQGPEQARQAGGMSKTIDQGKEEVAALCLYFTTNRLEFLAPGVKEAHIRQTLIDPLFEALGWDVRNKSMAAPQYREVIPEDSLDVEGQQKAPDYTFRVGTLPKFYVEAKKCGVNIGADPGPAFQLRRYGWSAKLGLSVLTDFEELAIYDCTARPRPSDKASHARIQYFRYEEYPDRWRELWDRFSREAVWSGAFDQYVASKRKRGTSEVDAEFLKEMEAWRLALASNIALRNKNLSLDDLNAAVQLTIDRVVFLRMAEDRGLEPYERLLKLCERPDIYPRFIREMCRRADQKYNSGLFHFQKESGVSEDPDRITPKLAIDDKVFKPILESLYFAHGSPYHFGVLPVEILGTVYERFLGKVIHLTAGHQARIEDKPEVRKAGGVYYTPAYIVEYIVKHTVGGQIEERSPAQLAGSKDKPSFRVLDMACGSGSFLLGAYRYLLDHCLNWYIEHKPENFKKAAYKDPRNGQWRLRIEEKKRILTTHIFGVDIDLQAVEVSKLSLLLKVLEGETDQSLSLSQLPFGDRALPNLADNIKFGNSLIGADYFTGKMFPDPEEMKRVNAFDWKQGFPDAMKAGGFDCIIGNPPYIPIESMSGAEREYFQSHYRELERKFDSSVIFILRALSMLTRRGVLGYISPITWQTGENYSMLRETLFTKAGVRELINLPFDVFNDAYVDTGVYIVGRERTKSYAICRFPKKAKVESLAQTPLVEVDSALVQPPHYKVVLEPHVQKLLTRLGDKNRFITLDAITKSTQGLAANRFKRSKREPKGDWYLFAEKVQAYRYRVQIDSTSVADMRDFPSLKQFYEAEPKILIRRVINRRDRLDATYFEKQMVFKKDLNPFVLTDSTYHPLFLLALLNSRLLSYLYINTSTIATKDDFRQTTLAELRRLPVVLIKFSDTADKALHDKMVALVDSMLRLHKQFTTAKSVAQKAMTQRQIDATDAEIDRLVYDLYGLTAEEIALVEQASAKPA